MDCMNVYCTHGNSNSVPTNMSVKRTLKNDFLVKNNTHKGFHER